MPQPILPLLPEGATPITDIVSVYRSAERWTYFLGINAIFSHAPRDLRSFRMIIGQLVCEGTCGFRCRLRILCLVWERAKVGVSSHGVGGGRAWIGLR